MKKRGGLIRCAAAWMCILCLVLTAGCSGSAPETGQSSPESREASGKGESSAERGKTSEAKVSSAESGETPETKGSSAERRETSGAGESSPVSDAASKEGQASRQNRSESEKDPGDGEISLEDIPAYTGDSFVEIDGNEPLFSEEDLSEESFESYSSLDDLGRCGVAYACIGTDLMPRRERGAIGRIKPSGWHTVKYDFVDGKYLYNRCHLIGYQLTAENANERNLITGTRYMNVEGMLPFENMVADYVRETDNHVLYRVTPLYDGDDLLAAGVLMEAESVEDHGEGILYCVFVYNVQPGVSIDYADGDSRLAPETASGSGEQTQKGNKTNTQTKKSDQTPEETKSDLTQKKSEKQGITGVGTAVTDYVLNTNTKKFHLPGCSSIKQMDEDNRAEFSGTREELLKQGYQPCGRCHP